MAPVTLGALAGSWERSTVKLVWPVPVAPEELELEPEFEFEFELLEELLVAAVLWHVTVMLWLYLQLLAVPWARLLSVADCCKPSLLLIVIPETEPALSL
jgi:hypothetical protein